MWLQNGFAYILFALVLLKQGLEKLTLNEKLHS